MKCAASGGLRPAFRAAERQGFAGDRRRRRAPLQAVVLVRHPGHDDAAGVDVGGGNVTVLADEIAVGLHVGAGEALQLQLAQLLRIHLHAAFGAAIGQVDASGLEGHPKGQRHDLVHIDAWMKADAALGRTAQVAVAAAPGLE